MKKPDYPFFQPRRQAQAAVLIFVYNFLARLLRGVWPILLVLLFRSGKEQSAFELGMNALVAVGGAISLLMSIIAYYRYFYHIEAEQLVIQQGVLSRSRIKLPFERIQNLHIEQNVLHRLLGVVSLRVEAAGSSGSEVTINALARGEAEALRDYVLEQREAALPADEDSEPAAGKPQALVLALSTGDLLRVGASQNHLATAGIILGAIFGFVFTLAGTLREEAVKAAFAYWPLLNPNFWGFLSLAAMLIALAFLLTMGRTFARYYGLKFYETEDRFKLVAGLFNRREASLQKAKVQWVHWSDNPIRRWLGLYRLAIYQAAPEGRGGVGSLHIPGCRAAQVEAVARASFAGSAQAAYRQHGISFAYVLWHLRFYALLPALLFGGLGYFLSEPRFLLPMLAFPLFGALYLLAYRRRFRLLLHEEYLKTVRGVLSRSADLLPIYKVQSVSIEQSFFQRRRRLANVVLHTAAGSLSIPFLELELAQALQDYVLYRVERSDEPWM
jgi:putative membrane protein